jgi:F-type H+-transporting ATPase subunit b
MNLLNQVKGLFFEAVPTIVVVLVFYAFLRSQFFAPLVHAMEERARRTEGARREAEESLAAAQKAQHEYEAALRKARAEVYARQEVEHRKVLDQRAAQIHEAREKAGTAVRARKEVLAAEAAEARKQLEAGTQALGGEIARMLMAGRGSKPRVSGGAA